MVFFYITSLLIINNLYLSPSLVSCSSLSSMLCHEYERSALLSLKNSLSSCGSFPFVDLTADWNNGTDCCDWPAITCDPISHHVVELDISYSDFTGEIPVEISYLSKLQHLDLSQPSNCLVKMKMLTFHNIIFNMTNLEFLFLNGVTIDSTLPPSLTNLSSIYSVDLKDCNLRGELPANILNLPQLGFISLAGNHGLYAKFPLSNWSTSLRWIDLSSVNFSSKLPTSNIQLSQPNTLNGLFISGCSFYGRIPDWVWNFSISGFGDLNLSDNEFTGNINLENIQSKHDNTPHPYNHIYISNNYLTGNVTGFPWKQLSVVDLSYNMFDGPLPIIPIGPIRWFSASNNNFTGPIHSSICNLTSLLILDLSNNSLNGELPHCLGNMSNLIVLNLGSNNVSSTFSDATFSNCNSLEYLDLSVNWLKGLMPWSLAHCTSLRVLNLRNNKLRDRFPHWLGSLSHIQLVDLSCNGFFGSLPLSKSASRFPRIQILNLSNNNFSGKIPVEFVESFKVMMNNAPNVIRSPEYMTSGNLSDAIYFYSTTLVFSGVTLKYEKIITTLYTFDLSNNKFEGEIPDNIGKLISIHGLNLSHNQLTGPIPHSLGNLTLLNSLDLSSNKLTGKIPRELTSLASLGYFNVSENQLVGPIPHENHFDTFSADSYKGNPALCGFPLPECIGHAPKPQPSKENPKDDKDENAEIMPEWEVVLMGFGFGTFVSFAWGCYMLSIGRPLWLLKLVLFLIDLLEKRLSGRHTRPRRGRN